MKLIAELKNEKLVNSKAHGTKMSEHGDCKNMNQPLIKVEIKFDCLPQEIKKVDLKK